MKKLLERNEFLIYLCQQIIKLLLDHSESTNALVSPQPAYLSVQQLADKCNVLPRQVRRWVHSSKIVPQMYIGSSAYFSVDYIDNALETGVLRKKKKPRG